MPMILGELNLSEVGKTSVAQSWRQGEGGVAEDRGHCERGGGDLRELHTLLTSDSTAGANSVAGSGLGGEADHGHSQRGGGLPLPPAEEGHEAGLASNSAAGPYSVPGGGQERAGGHGERVRAGGGHQGGGGVAVVKGAGLGSGYGNEQDDGNL